LPRLTGTTVAERPPPTTRPSPWHCSYTAPMKRFSWVLVAAWFVVVGGACDKPKPLPSEEQAATDPAARQQAYANMSAQDRAQAAGKLTLAGEGADPDEVEALLKGAPADAERTALKQSSRRRFATQYAQVLEQKQKPGQVSAGGADGTTLVIKSEHCNKFLLENFVGAPEARTARLVGFTRIACESQGLKLAAEL
jgi:hypothetical protein